MMKLAQAMRRMRKDEKGFTLIELMVVIVIIGILAAIAIPQFANIINNSRVKADVATGKTMKDAVDRYYTDNGSYPSPTDTSGLVGVLTTATTNGTVYLNSKPTVAQNANNANINNVFTYTPSTGNITVWDYSQTSPQTAWKSGN